MKKSNMHLYTVLDPRPIECLGGICGPIQHPTEISESDIILMIRDGFTIYQHNPHNLREKVKVTRLNFNSITFKTSRYDGFKTRALNKEVRSEDKKVSAPAPRKEEKKKKGTDTETKEIEKVTSQDFESNK